MGERGRDVPFQHGRHRHHLRGGAGLVGVLDGRVAHGVAVGLRQVVGVEAGRVGHGQDLAGAGVLDDDVTPVRPGLLHLLADRVLRGPLDVAVDGQLDVGAGHGGGLGGPGRRHLAPAGLGVADLAVLPGQLLVQLLLDAAAALAVGVDPAQYPGGQVAVGVHALAAGVREDTGQHVDGGAVRLRLVGERGLQVLDLLPDLRGLPGGEPGVAGVPVRGPQLLDERGLVLAEDRGEQRGGLLRAVGDLQLRAAEHGRVGRDVVRVLADGEGDAVAVGDLAALGGQRVHHVPVLLGPRRVGARVDGLDLEQPHHEGEQHQGQGEADQAQPGPGAAEPERARHRGPGPA